MKRLVTPGFVVALFALGGALLLAQEGGPKGKLKKEAGNDADCKRECEAKIKSVREDFHQTVQRLRREMEAGIAAIRANCKGGVGAGTPDHPGTGKPGGETCDCCCETHCKHSPKGVPKGNNGVGNGIDPQPPGNPPVNDGPGTGPGNPGNKGAAPGKSKDDKGKPHDYGGANEGKDRGGPPPGKGKHDKGDPHEDKSDRGKDKGGSPGGKGNGKS